MTDLVTPTYANAEFHQRLRRRCAGSFEALLASYTLSPALGTFQSWANVPELNGVKPNETMRQLIQLFTIGVNGAR